MTFYPLTNDVQTLENDLDQWFSRFSMHWNHWRTLKIDCWAPCSVSDSVGLRWGLRFCTSEKFPGGVNAAGSEATLGEPLASNIFHDQAKVSSICGHFPMLRRVYHTICSSPNVSILSCPSGPPPAFKELLAEIFSMKSSLTSQGVFWASLLLFPRLLSQGLLLVASEFLQGPNLILFIFT